MSLAIPGHSGDSMIEVFSSRPVSMFVLLPKTATKHMLPPL